MIFDVMGYGRPLEDAIDPALLMHMAQCFEDSLSTLAGALGIELDGFERLGETAAATERVELADGAAIETGTVAALRMTVAALRDGKPVLRFRSNWYCSKALERDWELGDNGWRVQVEGDAPLDLTIGMPLTGAPVAQQMSGYTAYGAVNAIPYVCAAAPGIRTTVELPRILAYLG
jgi:4-hydroxy-tetrahydrodipicolinate reductase